MERLFEIIGFGEFISVGLGAALVVATALALARRRGVALSGAEVALYWLGSSLTMATWAAMLFDAMNWYWPWYPNNNTGWVFSGLLTAAALAALSGAALRVWWTRRRGA